MKNEKEEGAAARAMASERPAGATPGNANVGDALRNAFQKTIDEGIPPEMLDLLGKLD